MVSLVLAGLLATACGAGNSQDVKITVRCDRHLGITEAMKTRGDWGGTSQWGAVVRGDTLVLSRRGSCGDECRYKEEIVLLAGDRMCPQLVSATKTRTDAGSVAPAPRIDTATHGTLDVQDWHPGGGVVSGRLKAEFTLTFYVQTPTPASRAP
ncbi:MAG TPA: hypothetical protein VFH88_00445 [Candidatus Krumholzibacteria bacterium]|nr:hypothetical protein [Candidatus Krumholzibacteria bacterium]